MKKKIIFIIAQDGFRDEELFITREVLEKEGCKVSIASATKEEAIGSLGGRVTPDMLLSDIKVTTFDAVVVVGGHGSEVYFDDEFIIDLLQQFHRAGKIIGALASGVGVLANAGLLMGKEVTSYHKQEQMLKERGAFYTGMPVEVNGLLLTARDAESSKAFAEKLVYILAE